MALVDYSDSEGSDTEAAAPPKPSSKPVKGTFLKVVDRSHSGKIRVSLPQQEHPHNNDDSENPKKRLKTVGGALKDFKSFLPPPKRPGQPSTGGLGGDISIRRSGLGAGVNLKTGAAPVFSRSAEVFIENSELLADDFSAESHIANGTGVLTLPPPKTSPQISQISAEEIKLVGNPFAFKPLSVARNPPKKKKKPVESLTTSSVSQSATAVGSTSEVGPAVPKPRVSLFSVAAEKKDPIESTSNGDYQPMVYGVSIDKPEESATPSIQTDPPFYESNEMPLYTAPTQLTHTPDAQSLNDIASDLNLSAAARRQLFGRQKGSSRGDVPLATKVINFNMDKEYRNNEELRAAGEQAVHNPVRAIAPGKHSLKQLINAAASQKDALEESFAKGKNNRAEASSRYGW